MNHKELARQLRHIASRCLCEPSDGIARELRALADKLYPPIKTPPGAQTVTRNIKGRRVTVKSATRKNFRILVGK